MKKNNKKGFTLVELVIVVAVMAILVAVAIPTVRSITSTASDAVAGTNAKTIESMIKLHEAEIETGKCKIEGTTYTALSNTSIAAALNNSDMGIKSESYTYTVATSIVAPAAENATGSSTVYLITFDENGACTVSAGS